jgi:hypothetical protein
MKWQWSLIALVLLGFQAPAQELLPAPASPTAPTSFYGGVPAPPSAYFGGENSEPDQGSPLSGNHNFPRFINFISNPLQSIDPRAVTAFYPLFASVWTSTYPPIPSADAQLYGPAITVALGERFAFGLCDGGYVDLHLSRNDLTRLARLDPLGRFRDVEAGGSRTGFTNQGGFFQYTLIENVEDQFLVTGGVRWVAPGGSHEVFQGHGPLELSPYLTLGKEFGEFHALLTTGYQFPAGPGNDHIDIFYANIHLDRRIFGWLYPLIEFNTSYHTTSVGFGLPTRRGFFDFGAFESSGNTVLMAAGANAVIVPERFELGAVYTTSIATQHDFNVNGLLVKMTLRY